ncbi:MAG: PH domain-containing protein [Actinobacteria bacterium]|nr:PH domain-containing protein [Actinomycetota bacterium]
MDHAEGEHVIFEGHPSWRSVLAFHLKGLVLVLLVGGATALVTALTGDEVDWGLVAVITLIAFVLLVAASFVKRLATKYVITNRRLRIRRGIIARHVQEARLERVQNVNTNQSALERLLQVGTVDFDTAGSGDSEFAFVGVAQPEKVSAAVDEALREARDAPADSAPGL